MRTPKRSTGPHSRVFKYRKDEDASSYLQTSGDIGFEKVPQELILESIRHPETIKAETFIRGRQRENGRYKFQTGLRQIAPKLFYGDHYKVVNGKKTNSFILFQFSEDLSELVLHYFNNFKLYPRYRGKFITNYLRGL